MVGQNNFGNKIPLFIETNFWLRRDNLLKNFMDNFVENVGQNVGRNLVAGFRDNFKTINIILYHQ